MFPSLHVPFRLLVSASVLIAGALGTNPAHAVSMCINSAAMFQSAMTLGQFQSEPLKLMLVQGTYALNASIDVDLSARTSIEGGYTAGCASRTPNPDNTIINFGGGNMWHVGQPDSSPEALLAIDGITFTNSFRSMTFSAGEGVHIGWDNDGSVEITRTRFSHISSDRPAYRPIDIRAQNNRVLLENVAFDDIAAGLDDNSCAVYISGPSDGQTLLNHVSADLAGTGNLCLYGAGTQWDIYNSILRSHDLGGGHVLGYVFDGSSYNFVNNILFAPQIDGDYSERNSLSQNPRWVDPVNGNFHLATNPLSPAINSGDFVPPGGEPQTDIEGNPRVRGSFPDRGAYESTYNDQATLTVTNANDSGSGSLRQAILDANSSPLIAKRVEFNIRGANQVATCPAVIALSSSLPAIAAPIALDGYTQPLSHPNTDTNIFNAVTCILIKPASGSLPVGFKVGPDATDSVAFNLRGVGMGGFSQPVLIQGGTNHVIAGNQFGGTALGVNLPGASINAISIGVNVGGSVIIGGPGSVDRNVIVDADFSGINIQSQVQSTPDRCQVVNNLIGLKPDGHTPSANNVGINVSGSGCGLFNNRVAGNTVANVWLQGGSQGNVLQKNVIGVGTDGQGISNSATGVLVSGSGNLIGAPGMNGTAAGNTIRFNSAGGVVVLGDAASGNTINGNLIYDNGVNGMDIDLQSTGTASGPTPNDPGDADVGANGLQNFPVAKQLVYTAAGSIDRPATIGGVLDSKPGSYRIDAYYSDKTSPIGKRGHAQAPLARFTLTVPANGRGSFTVPVIVPSQVAGGAISFTATDSAGNTSEVGSALLTDTIFSDGVD